MNIPETNLFAFDETAAYYPQLGNLLVSVATDHCNVTVDQVTHERWRDVMGLMRDVDTNADGGLNRSIIADHLSSFNELGMRYPSLRPHQLGNETHQALQRRAMHILKIGELISHQTVLGRYAYLRSSEARHTARLFSDSATDIVQEQPAFRDSFMPLLERMAISATLLDSAVDVSKDFASGKTTMAPLHSDRMKLFGMAVQEALPVIPAAAHLSVLGQLGISGYLHMKRHVLYGRAK